jgi:coenzyme F420-reducing hydrogenase delta subunit/NAD-dependent dihydropyrimidine dehydrogenase PreA subunit
VGGAALLPWLARRRDAPPVRVDPARCTGCELCARDCPYGAICMVPLPADAPHPQLAQIDAARCVSCGVCVGSCLPLALSLDGRRPEALWRDVLAAAAAKGAPVKLVFICERHALHGAAPYLARAADDPCLRVIPLTCAAMASPSLVAAALEAGAAEARFVGCPPEDCKNREGNHWQQDRLTRDRPPRLKAGLADARVATDWVSPVQFAAALKAPGEQPVAASRSLLLRGRDWIKYLPAFSLLALVVVLAVALSRAPYTPYPAERAALEVQLRHQDGQPLLLPDGQEVALQSPFRLVLTVDDRVAFDRLVDGSKDGAQAFEQVAVAAGRRSAQLIAAEIRPGGESVLLYDGQIKLEPRQVLTLSFASARPTVDARAGERLFAEAAVGTNAGCRICHSLRPGVKLVGPSLAGVATRAETRVPGLPAEAYLRQSILTPDAYVVEGYPAGQMLPDLGKALLPEQLDDLVAFLLTLK